VTSPRLLLQPLRSAVAFDLAKIDLGFALRSTVGVAIPLLLALAAGNAALGGAAAIGALSAGFASQQGVYRTRAAAMLWTSAGMALSAFVGASASHSSVAIVAATAGWGYAYGLVASLGPAATAAGLNSTIALIVFSNLNLELSPAAAALQAACVFAGGALQTLLLVLVWPIGRFGVERRALAAAYRTLASYAQALADVSAFEGKLAPPAATPIVTVRSALADPRPFATRADSAAFQLLLDEAERIRGTLAALAAAAGARVVSGAERACVGELAVPSAEVLRAVARALEAARAPGDVGRAWARIAEIEQRLRGGGAIAVDARALFGQLRSAWRVAEAPAEDVPQSVTDDGPGPSVFPRLADALATLRANVPLASPFGRLGVRLAVALAVAVAVYRVYDLRNGYWLALTTVLLLKPDYTTTVARAAARVAGTLLGAAVATLIASYLAPGPHALVALCIAFAALGYVAFNANYAVYATSITAYVIFMLALLGQPERAAVSARVIATLGGSALATLAMLVWPTWESKRATDRLADLLDAEANYVEVLLRAYLTGERTNSSEVRAAQSAAWSARAEAEASVDRMLAEPQATHAIAAHVALGVLAASRGLGLGLLALNVHGSRERPTPRPELAPLAQALASTLRADAVALRTGRPADSPVALRALLPEDAADVPGELDFIVDSTNTISGLLRGGEPAADVREPNAGA